MGVQVQPQRNAYACHVALGPEYSMNAPLEKPLWAHLIGCYGIETRAATILPMRGGLLHGSIPKEPEP